MDVMRYRVSAVRASSSALRVEVDLEEQGEPQAPSLGVALTASMTLAQQPKIGQVYRLLMVEDDAALEGGDCVHCHQDPKR